MGIGARAAEFSRAIFELPGGSNRFAAMEGLRAWAALLVFAVHYFDAYARGVLGVDPNALRLATVPDLHTGLVYFLFASHYGVDVFFLLSGFLICRMTARGQFVFRLFLRNRLIRIYPAFLLSLALWAWIRIGWDHWYGLDPTQLVGNLLFLNAVPALGIKPYSTVTWSLFFEAVFYLTFPLVRWLPGARRQIAPWMVLAFALPFMAAMLQLGGFFIRALMFIGGALLATQPDDRLRRVAKRLPTPIVLVAHLGAVLLFAWDLAYHRFIPVFFVTTSLLFLATLYGGGQLQRFFSLRPLRYFGNVSYSFYLVHGLGIELVSRNAALFADLPAPIYLIVTLPIALGVGFVAATLLFLLAEKPYFSSAVHRGRT